MKLLDQMNEPEDIKKLDIEQLAQLSREIRKYLIEVVSECGGHLSSNLGVVELTLALHYCFNSPIDKLVWDVGHQSYVHKILTGRKKALKTIRQFEGLSGFPKTCESVHDAFNTGHSSTSISAALGMAKARDIKGENGYIIPIIGDGALTGGMAFEALNNAGNMKSNFIVVLNDNQMSISKNVGGISLYLDDIRTAHFYKDVKVDIQKVLRKIPKYGEDVVNVVRDMKDGFKQIFVPGMFFEEMGFTYLGPVDGHNLRQVITTLNQAKKVDGPVLVHINTVKGKGYKFAEQSPSKFHGVKPFLLESGKEAIMSTAKTYSSVFGETLIEMAKTDPSIVAVTAAMPEGTGLNGFAKMYPDRFFDVGIAEQHAITFSGGLAISGMKPYVAIYSSFLQRAYDQLIHDIAIQKLPVVIGIDRSGIVGEDGETHQGLFDTSFLNHMPNMTIMVPKDGLELAEMLRFSSRHDAGPIAIKYPRGSVSPLETPSCVPIELGKMETLRHGKHIALVCSGTMTTVGEAVSGLLVSAGYDPTLVNTRFIKPLDHDTLLELGKKHTEIVIIEENMIIGGLGSEILRFYNDTTCKPHVMICGIDDCYVPHGAPKKLYGLCGLNPKDIFERIIAAISPTDKQVRYEQ